MQVSSTVRMDFNRIRQLTQAQITALELTAEELHTDIVQAQVMPRDTGNLQNESTFIDYTDIQSGRAVIVSSTPYARIFILNIISIKARINTQGVNGTLIGSPVEKRRISAGKFSKSITGG